MMTTYPFNQTTMIDNDVIDEVKRLARIEEVAERLHGTTRKGKEYRANCPSCRKVDGLHINAAKQMAKCFSCGAGCGGALAYLTKLQGKPFPEAVRYLADMYNVIVNEQPGR